MPIQGIDHPAIACHDLASQADWYCRVLQMRIVAQNQTAALVAPLHSHNNPPAMIELMSARDPGPNPDSAPRFSPGIRHLAFRVPNINDALKSLKEKGVQFLFEPAPAIGGGWVASFRDPEGNELQVVERPPTI